MEDIPEALRDRSKDGSAQARLRLLLLGGLLTIGGVALAGFLWLRFFSEPQVVSTPTPIEAQTPMPLPSVEPSPTPVTTVDSLLGHLAYEEAPQADLTALTADGQIRLRTAAAEKFQQMLSAARADGVVLVPLSGFRSKTEQDYLFFNVKEQRGQEAEKRAEVSAPPGYSEHHTGYAIDIGDGQVPATHLNPSFENTPAFRWLENNASRYSFELSFPRDNPQKISYEPWHWRFVGNSDSLETFYKAKDSQQPTEP